MGTENQRRRAGHGIELAEFMAPDSPLPDRDTPERSAWVVGAAAHAHLLLLHIMAALEDVLDGEAENSSREEKIKAEIRQIRPSDAPFAVEAILGQAKRWLTESGYAATYTRHRPAIAKHSTGELL